MTQVSWSHRMGTDDIATGVSPEEGRGGAPGEGARVKPDTETDIGRRIRFHRRRARLSLEQVAHKIGITTGALSKIETGKTSPSVHTLIRLAGTLGVEVGDFFVNAADRSALVIVRRRERRTVARRGTEFGYGYQALAHTKRAKIMEPFIMVLRPHSRDNTMFQHEGEEFMFVLKGKMEFLYQGQRYLINEGDAIYYDSGIPHRGQNGPGQETPAIVLSVIATEPRGMV